MENQTEIKIKPYANETLNFRQGVGVDVVPAFIERFKLQNLKSKIQKSCIDAKEQTGRPVVISFVMQKGGSGKSTSCVCIAQLVANLGFKTLVLDIDDQKTSYSYLNGRIENFTKDAQISQSQGVPEEEFIKKKGKTDPFVAAEHVHPNTFSTNWFNENLDRLNNYDVVFIDTPGTRTDGNGVQGMFELEKAGFTGVSHITSAVVSNLIVLPTRQTGFDLDVFANYCLAMMLFVQKLRLTRLAFCEIQIRALVTSSVNRGSIYDEYIKVKETYSKYVPFLENTIGMSQKLGNLKSEAFASLFDRRNSIVETLFLIADEMFDAVNKSFSYVEKGE